LPPKSRKQVHPLNGMTLACEAQRDRIRLHSAFVRLRKGFHDNVCIMENSLSSATQYCRDWEKVFRMMTNVFPVTVRIQTHLTHTYLYTNILLAAWVTGNPLPYSYNTRVRKGDGATPSVPPRAPCDPSHLNFLQPTFCRAPGLLISNVQTPRLG
jgi:hypothetical protein